MENNNVNTSKYSAGAATSVVSMLRGIGKLQLEHHPPSFSRSLTNQ